MPDGRSSGGVHVYEFPVSPATKPGQHPSSMALSMSYLQYITSTVSRLLDVPVSSEILTEPFASSHVSVKGRPGDMLISVVVNSTAQHRPVKKAKARTNALLTTETPISKL